MRWAWQHIPNTEQTKIFHMAFYCCMTDDCYFGQDNYVRNGFNWKCSSGVAPDTSSRGSYIANVSCEVAHTHTRAYVKRHEYPHTHTRSAVKSTGLYSRGFGDFEESNGCRVVVETSSHAPRKVSAVSLSSTSSAAVASILPREKSLMESPSTTFQVLFCWGGKH